MKKIIIFFSLLIIFCSCSDFLDLTNPENAANDFFQKGDAEAEQLVNAVYSTLQIDAFYSRFLPMLCEIRSDEACLTPNASKMEENFMTVAIYNSDAAEKFTINFWDGLYFGIMRTNFALERIPQMANASEDVKKRLLGETYFLRAFFNWHLVMNFGEAVPIKTAVSVSQDQFEQGPGNEGELWDLIISDLIQSQSLLKEVNYTNNNSKYQKGRITLGASTAFLGQAYLFYAQMKGKPEYYQKAADEFAKVILQQVGTYSLEYNYKDNFTEDKKYNAESVFEIGFNYIGTDVWGFDGVNGVETNWLSQNAGMTSNCSKSSARWWNLAPANSLLRHYENGDYRKWMNLWCENGAYYIDLEGTHAYNPTGSLLSMNFPANPYPKGEEGNYLGFRKYEYDYNQAQDNPLIESTKISSKYSGAGAINFRVMRYADVLLMYAECMIAGNTGNPANKDAMTCITEIRRRANHQLDPALYDLFQYEHGNSDLPYFHSSGTLPDLYTKSADPLTRLQHERMVEFAGEGKRYYDIIRWYKSNLLRDIDPDSDGFGNSINTTSGLATMLRTATFAGKFLLPIPQYELNTNPKMIGNESN